MTVSSTTRKAGPYTGTGLVTTYPFSFKIFAAADVLVITTTSGLDTTLVLGAGYTVAMNSNQDTNPGGNVILTSALAAGVLLTLGSQVSALQTTDITNAGGFFPQVIEDALDRAVILIQQFLGGAGLNVSQFLRVPDSAGVTTLPAAGSRANYLLSFDSSGNPVAIAPSSGSAAALAIDLASTASGKGAALVAYSGAVTYAAGTAGFHAGETYYANDYPWLCTPGLTTDQSTAMQAAFDFVKSVGGELKWKPGRYLGRIDFSGTVVPMVFDGQGAEFRPYSSTQGEVFYCKNSATYPAVSGNFISLNVLFRNVSIVARLTSASSDTDTTGHCDYGVNFICASAKWYDSSFQYGRIAAYRGYYHQYGEFYSCLFGASVYAAATAGCLLDGNTTTESSNENRFFGPKFFSCKNGLVIKGGIKNRIYSPTIQDTRAGGTAGIWLTADGSGFGADNTTITDSYLEINAIPGITVGAAPNTTISNAALLSSSITSTHCYNLSLRDCNSYAGGTITLAHPGANADTASLTVSGGNVTPDTSGLIHNGPTNISFNQPGVVTAPSGQTGTGGVTLLGLSHVGFKSAVARTVTTSLFKITQQSFSTTSYRYDVFELMLFAVDDNNATTQFGYSARVQRNYLFITNNSGTLQAFVSASIDGADIGISTGFTAPGAFTVTVGVSGSDITVSVSFAGAGSTPAATAQLNVGYQLRGMSGNPVTLTRL